MTVPTIPECQVTSDPVPSRPVVPSALDGFQLDISHQELDRILCELDAIYLSQPTTWLPCEAIGMMLTHELGYEDLEEFEDALKTSWPTFLSALPHVELSVRENNANTQTFRVKPPPPLEEQVPTKLTFRVTTRQDLWRVCLKAQGATACIPELEFEIGADSKRHVDSIYNHVGAAIFNLSTYVRSNPGLSGSDQEKIAATVDKLNQCLDVDEPWTWVINDPHGLSELKPTDNVEITRL